MRRARIGIDGNCGFAGVGANLQEGTFEFVEIAGVDRAAQCAAAAAALELLRAKLAPEVLSYELDESHPNWVG
jgi:hypothetical protein